MQRIIYQFIGLRRFWLPIILVITVSYSLYFVLDNETVSQLGAEDQLFENLTALFFLVAAIVFFRSFLACKNYWFLLLAIVFFVGFGEEISWGQRILQIETPDLIARINVQRELTLHNIELFNSHYFDHNLKSGTAKLLTINFLYKLFWLTYCILLPIACLCWRPIASLVVKMRLPIPCVLIGMFFLVNWIAFKGTSVFLLPSGKTEQYYDTIVEMRECISAFIFMVIAIHFMYCKDDWQTTTTDDPAKVFTQPTYRLEEDS